MFTQDQQTHTWLLDWCVRSQSQLVQIITDTHTYKPVTIGSRVSVGELFDGKTPTFWLTSIGFLQKHPQLNPKWHNPDTFRISNLYRQIPELMFNRTANFYNLDWVTDNFVYLRDLMGGDYFIRPDNGFKSFPSQVVGYNPYDFLNSIKSKGGNEQCLVAPCNPPVNEYRMIIVNGKIITGSAYRLNGEVDFSDVIPNHVDSFVEDVLTTPGFRLADPVYVMDVAEIPGEQIGVMETNSIHTSGYYACDVDKIMTAIRPLLLS
jgi:hypothetical protein